MTSHNNSEDLRAKLYKIISVSDTNKVLELIATDRQRFLDQLEAELPEKDKYVVIEDLGDKVPNEFVEGYSVGKSTGKSQALDDVRAVIKKAREK